MSKVTIRVFSRIHISLLDLANDGYRSNGGIGFFINSPFIEVKIIPFSRNIIFDTRQSKLPLDNLINWLDSFLIEANVSGRYKINISGFTESHKGFGVSTAVRMAVVEGIALLSGKTLSNEDIIKYSHRGGTSGVGVHGYFSGGLVFDLGHDSSRKLQMPSRCLESASHFPLLLKNLAMPNWRVGILIPKNIAAKTHEEEKRFFEQNCPLAKESVYETTYHALFGVLASVETEDFEAFCSAINEIQNQPWKRAERYLYPELLKFELALKESGAKAIGMSSLGPSLYFFAEDLESVINCFNQSGLEAEVLFTSVNNSGRVVEHV